MSKSLSEAAISSAMRNSVKLARTGTPEQRAGMFKPSTAAKAASTKSAKR